jgi:3-oxoacyl-[acyl-carrier-protein] synthase-1
MSAAGLNCYLSWPGLLCALGNDPATIMRRLLAADNSGLVVDETLSLAGPVHVGAVQAELPKVAAGLADFDCRNNRLLLAALAQIESSVRVALDRYGADRIAVVLGSSTAGISDGEAALAHWQAHGAWPAGFDYRQQEVGTVAEFLARHLGLGNIAITISTACSSSAKAFASARNLLAAGICDAVLVGGVDTLCRLTINGFTALESVSRGRCTPFEAARDGINIGEGAALFVMTRDAGPLRLCAVGESSDAYHMSAPQPEGLGAERAMRAALAEAQLQPSDIGYINLHGTATPKNDEMESAAVARVFGTSTGPACSSTKALTGHTLGAAGAVEAALCALLLSAYNPRQQLPPQRFVQGPDPRLAPIRFAADEYGKTHSPEIVAATQSIRYVLSNSFAFGGSNAVVILGRGNTGCVWEQESAA